MPTLFSPLSFAGLTLRNRVAMPPMWSGKATADGLVTPAIIDYHRVRAAAGTALIIVEHAFVHPQGRHSSTQIGVHDDVCVDGSVAARRGSPRRGSRGVPADLSRRRARLVPRDGPPGGGPFPRRHQQGKQPGGSSRS